MTSASMYKDSVLRDYLECQQLTRNVCDIHSISSDACHEFICSIYEENLSKWHFAWLAPLNILANVVAILLAPIAMLAHLITSTVMAIFATCTSSPDKKFLYHASTMAHLAWAFSAITDKICTSIVRIFNPFSEKVNLVEECLFPKLAKHPIESYLVGEGTRLLFWQLPSVAFEYQVQIEEIVKVEISRVMKEAKYDRKEIFKLWHSPEMILTPSLYADITQRCQAIPNLAEELKLILIASKGSFYPTSSFCSKLPSKKENIEKAAPLKNHSDYSHRLSLPVLQIVQEVKG